MRYVKVTYRVILNYCRGSSLYATETPTIIYNHSAYCLRTRFCDISSTWLHKYTRRVCNNSYRSFSNKVTCFRCNDRTFKFSVLFQCSYTDVSVNFLNVKRLKVQCPCRNIQQRHTDVSKHSFRTSTSLLKH
jgi:hypothetical protein